MVERFENDESSFLSWADANPFGFILNVGQADDRPRYPMVHAVRHALWSWNRDSTTRGHYIRVCSGSLEELEHWAQENYGCRLSHCRCMFTATPSPGWKGAVTMPDVTGVELAIHRESSPVDTPGSDAGDPDGAACPTSDEVTGSSLDLTIQEISFSERDRVHS